MARQGGVSGGKKCFGWVLDEKDDKVDPGQTWMVCRECKSETGVAEDKGFTARGKGEDKKLWYFLGSGSARL